MDDSTAFLELSALLTGLYGPLLTDPEDRALNQPIATEYARRLRGTFGDKFKALLDAYKALATAIPKPPVDDALLAKLRATQAFTDNEVVARQIVNVWYFSQFNDESGAQLIDGDFFEDGAVWPRIKAHPIGFSTQPHGVMGAAVSPMSKPLINPQTGRMNWNTAAHIMGTAVMGDVPADSVVDRWGRAHDVPNLWVVGSSVFPTASTANPTLTIAALTLRTAQAIHRTMRAGA